MRQLAAVDALLVQSGYDAAAAASTPSAARDGADGADEGGADPRDAGALYSRALEMYGVNADADATKEKIRAVKARARRRGGRSLWSCRRASRARIGPAPAARRAAAAAAAPSRASRAPSGSPSETRVFLAFSYLATNSLRSYQANAPHTPA